MPTFGAGPIWDQDFRRWLACMKQASNQMIAEGWPPHARKFLDVQKKRARRLWYS